MFIRIFADTRSRNEAIKIFNNAILCGSLVITSQEIIKIEPYWKIKDIFVVEAKINFIEEIDSNNLKIFLDNIADDWLLWGDPIEEALATCQKSTYIKEGINMINVFIEEGDA
jgi:hypothetical protein